MEPYVTTLLCLVVLLNTVLWFTRFCFHASALVDKAGKKVLFTREMDRDVENGSWWMNFSKGDLEQDN